jgi:hypothetical protein
MAAVEVTISGVLYDKLSRTTRPVVLIGEASLTGLEIGGGPIIPPGSPPGIWGPPTMPPGFWGGGMGPGVKPQPPIPPIPTEPPPSGGDKPPPESGGWGYVAEWSAWGYFPASDEASPKA